MSFLVSHHFFLSFLRNFIDFLWDFLKLFLLLLSQSRHFIAFFLFWWLFCGTIFFNSEVFLGVVTYIPIFLRDCILFSHEIWNKFVLSINHRGIIKRKIRFCNQLLLKLPWVRGTRNTKSKIWGQFFSFWNFQFFWKLRNRFWYQHMRKFLINYQYYQNYAAFMLTFWHNIKQIWSMLLLCCFTCTQGYIKSCCIKIRRSWVIEA